MSELHFYDPNVLSLWWAIPLLAALLIYWEQKSREAWQHFVGEVQWRQLGPTRSRARVMGKAALLLGGIALVVFAAARPAWDQKEEEVERRGRDVVFVLDVSRSMLAEDLAPNRLERAKFAIMNTVKELSGDRVALIVFSGYPVIVCPLTFDYGFFQLMLEGVQVSSVGRGGTMLGDALRAVESKVFDGQQRAFKDVVLITDGEDQGSFPEEAAAKLGDTGARLIVIGIGSEERGARIPVTDEKGTRRFLTHEGQEVWSTLDADTLRETARATAGGVYLNVGTGAFDLAQIYTDLIASAEERALGAQRVVKYQERFQLFLAIGLAMLCVEWLVPRWRSS